MAFYQDLIPTNSFIRFSSAHYLFSLVLVNTFFFTKVGVNILTLVTIYNSVLETSHVTYQLMFTLGVVLNCTLTHLSRCDKTNLMDHNNSFLFFSFQIY